MVLCAVLFVVPKFCVRVLGVLDASFLEFKLVDICVVDSFGFVFCVVIFLSCSSYDYVRMLDDLND